MRQVFFALLLANVLVWLWHGWVPPRGAAQDSVDGRVATLRALNSQTAPPAFAGECLRIGPFADGSAMQQLRRRLGDRGLPVRRFTREGRIWSGHWVVAGGLTSAEETEEARRRFVAAGIEDAYRVDDGAGNAISLGIFRERERAERVAAIARELGYTPETRARYQTGAEHWLLVPNMAGSVALLESLPRPAGRILHTEVVACRAPDTPPDTPLGSRLD